MVFTWFLPDKNIISWVLSTAIQATADDVSRRRRQLLVSQSLTVILSNILIVLECRTTESSGPDVTCLLQRALKLAPRQSFTKMHMGAVWILCFVTRTGMI